MYISKLKIKNFKCFDEVEINFDPNFNLIVGKNNSGKSTIFEALRLWQLAIQQFYTKRTGKIGDGENNIGFYKKYQFEPLELNDLSFLRIDSLYNILNQKIKVIETEDEFIFDNNNTFLIEITFANSDGKNSSVPIIFRPSDRNVLRCSIKYNSETKDGKFNELKSMSHKLSEVMGLKNNATFLNRIKLAYIPPKFTIPSKEVLFSKDNSFILEKLVTGESNIVIRNILHHWSEFSYQVKTKNKSEETIQKVSDALKDSGIDPDIVIKNFSNKLKPFIENVLEYSVTHQKNPKSKFLDDVEKGLKKIVEQDFYFKSINSPIDNPFLQIADEGRKTEISQLGSGTINILNILTVLNYNDESVKGDATKCNILLLDEPDSHLQFNLQSKLFEYLEYVSKDIGKQIFIVTHNSSLISQFDKVLYIKSNQKVINPIPIEEYIERELINIDLNHHKVIKDLSEFKKNQDLLLKQINQLKNQDIPLVYTEGPTDITILENAFKKLYPSVELPFNLINGFSSTQLKNTFEGNKIFEKNSTKQISIFDFDTAFAQWNGLWNGSKDLKYIKTETNPNKCLTKKHITHNGYALLLPVPEISDIRKQVLNPTDENINFGDKSVLQIEHLLYDVKSLNKSFIEEHSAGGKIITFIGNKRAFAEATQHLSKEDFKHFIPLFEKLAEIIEFKLPN